MSWDYRIVEAENGLFGVSEVYYDENKKPVFHTSHLPLQGETAETVREEYLAMANALTKPVLKEGKDLAPKKKRSIPNYSQLIKSVMRHPPPRRMRSQPFWSWVGMVFGLGSVAAFELCQEMKFDPENGEEYV